MCIRDRDIVARKRRLQGYNVLYPIGWDAFGLPTENFAIQHKIHPKVVTHDNISRFRKQLQSLGLSFDWSREVDTTDPGYYKWTQWIFLKMFERGLAYKKEMSVNFCTSVSYTHLDTFRAAAIDQLMVWADRVGVDIIKQDEGADPAAVVYDTICAAKSRNSDVIICDTAGRLHNKKNLMNELNKIFRVIERELPNASKEVLLVLDATTGQNALNQAKEFKNAADITGIVLTKLDGTAKGGIVFAIKNELDVPVKFIGVGEGMDDMQPFDGNDFVNAIFE